MSPSWQTESNSLSAAAIWLERLILGSVGTTIAIVSIAIIGFMMLTGRLPVRRGVGSILGCFILFGAPVIVQGLMTGLEVVIEPTVTNPPPEPTPIPTIAEPSPPALPAAPPMSTYDPYAGAAVPR